MVDAWVDDVLTFWFRDLEPADWFKKSDATDALITSRFATLHDRQSTRDAAMFTAEPRTALAAIILFDQFSRNMFRGTPESFASDSLALLIATKVVEHGWDQQMSNDERSFVYLPFEHSEDLANQDRCVALMSALGDDRKTGYAEAHRDVIVKFGRFPHRNHILGRQSTPEEVGYLAMPGSGF